MGTGKATYFPRFDPIKLFPSLSGLQQNPVYRVEQVTERRRVMGDDYNVIKSVSKKVEIYRGGELAVTIDPYNREVDFTDPAFTNRRLNALHPDLYPLVREVSTTEGWHHTLRGV